MKNPFKISEYLINYIDFKFEFYRTKAFVTNIASQEEIC